MLLYLKHFKALQGLFDFVDYGGCIWSEWGISTQHVGLETTISGGRGGEGGKGKDGRVACGVAGTGRELANRDVSICGALRDGVDETRATVGGVTRDVHGLLFSLKRLKAIESLRGFKGLETAIGGKGADGHVVSKDGACLVLSNRAHFGAVQELIDRTRRDVGHEQDIGLVALVSVLVFYLKYFEVLGFGDGESLGGKRVALSGVDGSMSFVTGPDRMLSNGTRFGSSQGSIGSNFYGVEMTNVVSGLLFYLKYLKVFQSHWDIGNGGSISCERGIAQDFGSETSFTRSGVGGVGEDERAKTHRGVADTGTELANNGVRGYISGALQDVTDETCAAGGNMKIVVLARGFSSYLERAKAFQTPLGFDGVASIKSIRGFCQDFGLKTVVLGILSIGPRGLFPIRSNKKSKLRHRGHSIKMAATFLLVLLSVNMVAATRKLRKPNLQGTRGHSPGVGVSSDAMANSESNIFHDGLMSKEEDGLKLQRKTPEREDAVIIDVGQDRGDPNKTLENTSHPNNTGSSKNMDAGFTEPIVSRRKLDSISQIDNDELHVMSEHKVEEHEVEEHEGDVAMASLELDDSLSDLWEQLSLFGYCMDQENRQFSYIEFTGLPYTIPIGQCLTNCLSEASIIGKESQLVGASWDEGKIVPGLVLLSHCQCHFDGDIGVDSPSVVENAGSGPVMKTISYTPLTVVYCFRYLGYILEDHFEYVGNGECEDDQSRLYDSITKSSTSSTEDCASSCRSTAESQGVVDKLIGMYYDQLSLKCTCYFDDQTLASKPSGYDSRNFGRSGYGPIVYTTDTSAYSNFVCWRHLDYVLEDRFTFVGYGNCVDSGFTIELSDIEDTTFQSCATECKASAQAASREGELVGLLHDASQSEPCSCVYADSWDISPSLTSDYDRDKQCWSYTVLPSYTEFGEGQCADANGGTYSYVYKSVDDEGHCARLCRGSAEAQGMVQSQVGFQLSATLECQCLFDHGLVIDNPGTGWTREISDSNEGMGEVEELRLSASWACNKNPDYFSKQYLLLNTASGGMKCLTYVSSPGSGEDATQFQLCDSSKSGQRFAIDYPISDDPEVFTLKAQSSSCLAAASSLTVVDCGDSTATNLLWIIKEGLITSYADNSKCIYHNPTETDAITGDCSKNEPKSHVSIMPYTITSQSENTYASNDPTLLYIFPENGCQLYGNGDYSSCKIDEWDVSLNEETTVEFDFSLDTTAGTTHSVCFEFENLQSALLGDPICFDLFDLNDNFAEGEANAYSLVLSEILDDDSTITFDDQYLISSIEFLQGNSDGSELMSRFSSIDVYNTLQVTVLERYKNGILISLSIPDGTISDDTSIDDMYFKPTVYLQDESGNYDTSVPGVGNRLAMDNFQVKISGLSSGKRFFITLDPVDASGQQFTDERSKLKAVFTAVTSCSCDDGDLTLDYSGVPLDLSVTQTDGYIVFEFSDNSVCEDAYTITRQEINYSSEQPIVAFAPSYFFYSTQPCTSEKLVPSKDYMDLVSALSVGTIYEYCVSAVGSSYMVDTLSADGSLVKTSASLCEQHTVEWESSALVRVTLKKESGALPVSNVTLDWELQDVDGLVLDSGTEETPDSGEVVIKLSQYPVLASRTLSDGSQLPLIIKPHKTSGDLNHTFLCNDEINECPEDGVVVYMSHLTFEKEIHIADATLIALRGTLYAGKSGGTEGAETTGCTLPGVEVCLYSKYGLLGHGSDIELECTESDDSGDYVLYAPIGTWVYPQANIEDHTFEPLDHTTGEKDYEKSYTYYNTGFYASSENLLAGLFDGHDFFDVTLAYLTVEVAGGLCDIGLGTANINVRLEGCSNSIYQETLTQSGVSGIYPVPAQVITVQLESIQANEAGDRQFVMDELADISYRIDLSEVNDVDEEMEEVYNETRAFSSYEYSNETTNENEEVLELLSLARFQYNGVLLFEPSILNSVDKAGGCSLYEITNSASGDSESFHVIGTGEDFDLSISVKRLIIPEDSSVNGENEFCRLVEDSTQVSIQNNVGLVPSDPTDSRMISILSALGDNLDLYLACTEGCIEPVEIEEDGSTSKVDIQLKAGLPRITDGAPMYDYSKTITIRNGVSLHTMYVVITGDYADQDGNSFVMPTMQPLLVIRDPPGGLSSVTYTNVESTVRITMDQMQKYEGVDFGAYLHAVIDGGLASCGGPLIALACADAGKFAGEIGANINSQRMWLSELEEDVHTHALKIIWSYSTPGSIGKGWAGQESDVFLVPSFAILFRTTHTVSFDESTCEASVTTSIKFDLASQENQKSLSFITYKQLQDEILPELDRNLEILLANTTGEVTEEEIDAVNSSIYGWEEALTYYNSVNEASESDTSSLLTINNWFSNHSSASRPDCSYATVSKKVAAYRCESSVSPDLTDPSICSEFDGKWECSEDDQDKVEEGLHDDLEWEPLPENHEYWKLWEFENAVIDSDAGSSALISSELASGKEILETTSDIANQIDDSYIDLESTNRIQFSGGGSLLTMTLDETKKSSYKDLFNDPSSSVENSDYQGKIGVDGWGKTAIGLGVLAGVKYGAGLTYSHKTSNRMIEQGETSEQTTITLQLGDPDDGDEFLVDVFLDPKYGTFVFNTVEGQSSCPWEKGTRRIEDPSISIIETTRPLGVAVSSDDLMTFDLEIANLGYGTSKFVLYHEAADNENGLEFTFSKAEMAAWTLPSVQPGFGGSSQMTTVTVAKGPKLNTYDSVRIYLQSKCESEGSFGSAKNYAEVYNKLEVSGSGYSKYIEFTEPCAEVQWSGDLETYGKFQINGDSAETLPITIYNPDRVSLDEELSNKTTLEHVWIEYRIVSDRKVGNTFQTWQKGLDETSQEIDFVLLSEDSFGYISAKWKYPSDDATSYEIRLRSTCDCVECPLSLQEFTSDSIFGLIDTESPRVFGEPSPLANLYPGQELAIAFTEDLDCELPHQFSVELEVSGFDASNSVFRNSELDVVCSSNILNIQFNEEKIFGRDYDLLFGREYTLTIDGVKDKSGNSMEDAFVFESNFICLPPNPSVSVSYDEVIDRQYLPHEPIVFSAVLSNDEDVADRSTSFLELGLDLKTNAADFSVLVNGEPLVDGQVYKLTGGESVNTTIAIFKGPGSKLRFQPLTLFLRSHCSVDSPNPIEVEVDLWNWEDASGNRFLRYTPKCPSVEWSGALYHQSRIVLGGKALGSSNQMLEVTVFNEGHTERSLFDRSIYNNNYDANLQDVVLLYRRKGDWNASSWKEGRLLKSNGTDMVDGVDFSTEFVEDEFGYATLYWDLSMLNGDSEYDVKVVSECVVEESTTSLDDASTDVIEIVLDSTPPQLYGFADLHMPSNAHPSFKEYVITFNEEIYCERPFTFELELLIEYDDGTVTLLQDNEGINVLCKGNAIKFRFDGQFFSFTNYDALLRSTAQLLLYGVEDLARNKLANQYETFMTSNMNMGSVSIETSDTMCNLAAFQSIVIGMGCDLIDQNCDGIADDCDEDLIPPTIHVVHGVAHSKTSDFGDDKIFISHRCFSSCLEASSFLEANVYAEDDCAQDILIEITEIASSQSLTKNHKYNITEFLVTATDSRCGTSPFSSVDEYFLVEVFDAYVEDVKQQGCNGIDENCDGVIDDCSEDRTPISISLSEGVSHTSFLEFGEDKIFISSHCFDSAENAKVFLESNVYAEDDCAQDIDLEINEVPSSQTREKNHRYNVTEFLVTATDSRCGVGTFSYVEKTFLVEVFDAYVEDVKQQGCNGIDENCDGVIDDCSEDRTPPVVSLKESVQTSLYNSMNYTSFITSPAFNSIDEATDFVLANIKAEDDCAQDLQLNLSTALADCHNSFLTVVASDPRCAETNPIQTIAKDIHLKVDSDPPQVKVGYEHADHNDYYDPDGKYLFIEESKKKFVNLQFWFEAEDSCPQDLEVEISVTSNELEYSSASDTEMVLLRKRNDLNQTHQLEIFLQPHICVRDDSSEELCEWDPQAEIRIYEVTATARDYGGNEGADKVSIIIVPKTLVISDKNERNAAYFDTWISSSTIRHVLLSEGVKFTVE